MIQSIEADLEKFRLALDLLYERTVTPFPLPDEPPDDEDHAQGVLSACENWASELNAVYGRIPGPPVAFEPATEAPHGVLGFFALRGSDDPSAPPQLADLLDLPPRNLLFARSEDELEDAGLLDVSGTWWSRLLPPTRELFSGELLRRWPDVESTLYRMLLHFRSKALRLIKWCDGRLAEIEDIELPRFQIDIEARHAEVSLAGRSITRRPGISQLRFLREMVEQPDDEQTGDTRNARKRLKKELPELDPFVSTKARTKDMRERRLDTQYEIDARVRARIEFVG